MELSASRAKLAVWAVAGCAGAAVAVVGLVGTGPATGAMAHRGAPAAVRYTEAHHAQDEVAFVAQEHVQES